MHGPARAGGAKAAALVLVVLGLLIAPSAASAAPSNDNYYCCSIRVNQPGSVLPTQTGFTNHTIVGATTEADMFAHDPDAPVVPENTACVRGTTTETFDSTVWYDIYPHRPGNLQVVTESPFQAMLAVVPFDGEAFPDWSRYKCIASSLGRAVMNYDFRLTKGAGYSIQVGRVSGSQGLFSMSVFFDPDTDEDGPVDSQDQCPGTAGKPELGGCPDADNDNVRDGDDQCPTTPGKPQHNGCPDRDNDNIRDGDDRCPDQGGPPQHRGCADTDGDGVADPDDRCQGAKGSVAHKGCPDGDGDGLADVDDKCPREDARRGRDRNGNGCRDREMLNPAVQLVPGDPYCDAGRCLGISVARLVVSEIPRGTRVTVTCTRRACRQKPKVAKGQRVRFFSGQKIRAGRRIVIRITRSGYVGRQLHYSIGRNDLDKSKLQCFAGNRAQRCTTQLLLR